MRFFNHLNNPPNHQHHQQPPHTPSLLPAHFRRLAAPAQARLVQLDDRRDALVFHSPRGVHGAREVGRRDLLDRGALLPIEMVVPAASEGGVQRHAHEAVVEADGEALRARERRESHLG
eukprot:163027-Prymnesium_polylepis.1